MCDHTTKTKFVPDKMYNLAELADLGYSEGDFCQVLYRSAIFIIDSPDPGFADWPFYAGDMLAKYAGDPRTEKVKLPAVQPKCDDEALTSLGVDVRRLYNVAEFAALGFDDEAVQWMLRRGFLMHPVRFRMHPVRDGHPLYFGALVVKCIRKHGDPRRLRSAERSPKTSGTPR